MTAEAERAARAAIEAFYRAWNTGDIEAVRATLNYPHVSFSPVEVVVRHTPADFESPARRLATEGWHHSTIDSATVLWASEDRVYVDVTFSRYHADGTRYLTDTIVYIVTDQGGHWGIQFRSR